VPPGHETTVKLKPQNHVNMNASTLYGTMQRHAGDIEIANSPGGDTSVQFAVPVREIILQAGRDGRPQAKPKRSLRILCIDDDPQVREFMNACLQHYDHRVMVASGGKQGLELFRTATLENQPYEVVITDLAMPDMDGHHVARMIKAESPHTPVIMMTGWGASVSDDGDAIPCVDVVVGKPPRMAELNDLLLRLAPGFENQNERVCVAGIQTR
jgi:CheY-like chemotaxis protein